MHTVNTLLLFLTSTMLFLPVGCRTTDGESGVKDSNFSKADPNKVSVVLWLASDGMVHNGSCPVASAVVDRNCPKLAETEAAIKVDDYKEKLQERIKLSRPKSKNGPAVPDAAVAQALLLKIDRIKSKLANAGLTSAETDNFQKQLDDLNVQYANARVDFSQEEQNDFDKVMKFLEAGQDITYDEGERLYNLALSPFMKGFSSYRLVVTEGPTTCSNTIVISELHLDFGSGIQQVTIAAPTTAMKQSAMVAGQAFELGASSVYSTSNSVSRVVQSGGSGWAPKTLLNANGAATIPEYLQFDFPNPVTLKGVAFAPGNNVCSLTAFHMEGSADATNFDAIPGAEWKAIAIQVSKQTYNW